MKTGQDLIKFITENKLEGVPLNQIITVVEEDRNISHNQIERIDFFEVAAEIEINIYPKSN